MSLRYQCLNPSIQKVAAWKGEVRLEGLSLRPDAFESLDLPVLFSINLFNLHLLAQRAILIHFPYVSQGETYVWTHRAFSSSCPMESSW